jgi:hypothetical protein
MAKYQVEDKLVLLENYMDSRFRYEPRPKRVLAVDDVNKLYCLINPNGTFYVPDTGDGNRMREQHWFSFQYVDNSYRLATEEEIARLF